MRTGLVRHPGGLLLALSLLVAAQGLVPAPLWAGVVLRIPREVIAQRDDLVLSDLGAVEGDPALAERLRSIRLGPAPTVGNSYLLDPEFLRARLRQGNIDPARVQIVAPDRIVVTRAIQVVPGSALVEAAGRQTLQRLETLDPRGGPYVLTPLSRPADLRVPTGTVDLPARLDALSPPYLFVAATVTVKVDGRGYQTVPLTFRVGRSQQVVVASHAIEPRTVLRAADFSQEARSSAEVPPGALATVAEPQDLEAVRSIRPGEIVTDRHVRPKLIVRRGETVTMLVEGSGFRITAPGLAAEDARRGDVVRLVNPASKREVLGRVEAPGVVRVGQAARGGQ